MERQIASDRGFSWRYLTQREHISRHERIKSLVREARDTNTVVAGSGHKEKRKRCHRSHIGRTEQKEGDIRISPIQKNVLRKDRGQEEIESVQRLAEEKLNVQRKLTESRIQKKAARKKIDMAEHHWTKATMRYRGWIPWLRQLQAAQLDYTKAIRVHQYCLTQRMWTNWMHFVQRSRAATTRLMKYKVARMFACSELILLKRAWRKWHCRQLSLAQASAEVRCNARNAVISSSWNRWVDAWKLVAIRHYTLNQRAILSRNRRMASKVMIEWKAAVHDARMEALLDEERQIIWGESEQVARATRCPASWYSDGARMMIPAAIKSVR